MSWRPKHARNDPNDAVDLFLVAERQIEQLQHELRGAQVTSQAQIDAITAQVEAADSKNQAAFAALQGEIGSLESQGVDVTNLTAAVAALAGHVDAEEPVEAPAPVDPAPEDPAATPSSA